MIVLHGSVSCACLVDLPSELIVAIYAHITDCRTVVLCRLVCKRLRDVIDASLELQYRIELDQDGMIPSSPSAESAMTSSATRHQLTTGDRLDLLRRLRRAWATLDWSRVVSVPMPGLCCAYELVGGVFCKTAPMPGGRVGFGGGLGMHGQGGFGGGNFGGGMAGAGGGGWGGGWGGGMEFALWHGIGNNVEVDHVPRGPRAMRATWLPGASGGRTVVRDDVGVPVRDFAMDPSQDVIVLFKGGDEVGIHLVASYPGVVELHVRTLSTNEPHPEARDPILCLQVSYPVNTVFVQIVDDMVGMMYCIDPSRPRITIWNWKTADLVVDRINGHLSPGTSDFSFLNSRALFLTTSNGGGTLELYAFTYTPRRNAGRRPPSYDHPTSTLIHTATLYLPAIQSSVRLQSIGTHAGPVLAACPSDRPFIASPTNRIHVVTVQYAQLQTLEGERRPKVCLCVHNHVLEEYVQKGLEKGAAEGMGAVAGRWHEWAMRARIVSYTGTFQWLRYVHGQRVALLHMSEAGVSTIQVLDFNVRRMRAARARGDEDDGVSAAALARRRTTVKVVDRPMRLNLVNIFTDVVESGLSYCEVRREVQGDYSGIMIDEERLIGLRYPAFLTGDVKEMDVFVM